MTEAERERTKFAAAFLNGIAIASATVGFMSPLMASLYNLVNAPPLAEACLPGSGWLIVSLVLYLFASWLLGDLDA